MPSASFRIYALRQYLPARNGRPTRQANLTFLPITYHRKIEFKDRVASSEASLAGSTWSAELCEWRSNPRSTEQAQAAQNSPQNAVTEVWDSSAGKRKATTAGTLV
jgi:hypothetical protein